MLNDLRVVELSCTSAAAFAGRFCADAGAEVILVEPPSGHHLRHEGAFLGGTPDPETSAAHLHVSSGRGFRTATSVKGNRAVTTSHRSQSIVGGGVLRTAPF